MVHSTFLGRPRLRNVETLIKLRGDQEMWGRAQTSDWCSCSWVWPSSLHNGDDNYHSKSRKVGMRKRGEPTNKNSSHKPKVLWHSYSGAATLNDSHRHSQRKIARQTLCHQKCRRCARYSLWRYPGRNNSIVQQWLQLSLVGVITRCIIFTYMGQTN